MGGSNHEHYLQLVILEMNKLHHQRLCEIRVLSFSIHFIIFIFISVIVPDVDHIWIELFEHTISCYSVNSLVDYRLNISSLLREELTRTSSVRSKM